MRILFRTRMAYTNNTIRVWYNGLYHTRMVHPIRVWLYFAVELLMKLF